MQGLMRTRPPSGGLVLFEGASSCQNLQLVGRIGGGVNFALFSWMRATASAWTVCSLSGISIRQGCLVRRVSARGASMDLFLEGLMT